jgi:hypothetical protein
MKKTSILLLWALLTSSCSVEQLFLIPTTTPTASATSTVTPTDVPSLTPTIATSTFTITPTLVGYKTETSTPEFTPTSTETPTVPPVLTTATPTVDMNGFVAVFTSHAEFFKKGICQPVSVKFTAQAANASGTAFVVLFVRFKSKVTGANSEWTSITMQNMGAGTFNHHLLAEDMKGVDSFRNSWVQYQLVATDSTTKVLGRTGIFNEKLTVLDCVPTPTPLISPTASTPTP